MNLNLFGAQNIKKMNNLVELWNKFLSTLVVYLKLSSVVFQGYRSIDSLEICETHLNIETL